MSFVTSRPTFRALSVRNFRLYMLGMLVSQSGTWMQSVALAVLVLRLTGEGTQVGVVFALQFLPILLIAPLGGMAADRVNNRKALRWTQGLAGTVALTLGVLVATDSARMWMVYVLATALGMVNAFDAPVRQTFVFAMAGPEHLSNAVGLNATVSNCARFIGPAIAGVFIAVVGLAACFVYNALSYVFMVVLLAMIRVDELHVTAGVASREDKRIRDGLRYVLRTPEILVPLSMLALVGTLSSEFPVSLPLFAEFTFDGGPGLFSAMMALQSIGGIAGAIYIASRTNRPTVTTLAWASLGLGVTMLVASVAPTAPIALVAMVPVGFANLATLTVGMSTLQLSTSGEMRGRVMALFTMAWIGSSAVGGPIVGWIGDHVGARWGLAVGAVAAFVAASLGASARLRASEAATAG